MGHNPTIHFNCICVEETSVVQCHLQSSYFEEIMVVVVVMVVIPNKILQGNLQTESAIVQ